MIITIVNKYRFKALSRVVLFFILFGCNSGNDNKERVEIEKDGNGNIVSELSFNSAGKLDGLIKYYYDQPNTIKEEIDYKDGVINGLYKFYTKNGILEEKSSIKNGLYDGYSYLYFKDGKTLKSKTFWKDNKSFGMGEWYYETGKLKLFNAIDFSEEIFFYKKNDETGDSSQSKGFVFSPNFKIEYVNNQSNTIKNKLIKQGQEIVIRIAVAQPPNSDTKITIKSSSTGKLEKLVIKDYMAVYKTTFLNKGKFTLVTIGELKDKVTRKIFKDSLKTILNVY